jgi:phage regulator Rha-like protein
MQNKLVVIIGNNVFTDSASLALGLNMEHRSIVALLKTHAQIKAFANIGTTKRRVWKKEVDVYLLSELQASLLIALMKNSPEVIDFKIKLVEQFYHMRQIILTKVSNEKNIEWLSSRTETKAMRKECTDIIQRFIIYAKEQGSKSAEKYYMNFSRMELTGLFILEERFPNARDVMSIRQLRLIEMADEAIAISLKDSMSKDIPYKECFQIAKEKVCSLAKIFPRSPLPMLLTKKEE